MARHLLDLWVTWLKNLNNRCIFEIIENLLEKRSEEKHFRIEIKSYQFSVNHLLWIQPKPTCLRLSKTTSKDEFRCLPLVIMLACHTAIIVHIYRFGNFSFWNHRPSLPHILFASHLMFSAGDQKQRWVSRLVVEWSRGQKCAQLRWHNLLSAEKLF